LLSIETRGFYLYTWLAHLVNQNFSLFTRHFTHRGKGDIKHKEGEKREKEKGRMKRMQGEKEARKGNLSQKMGERNLRPILINSDMGKPLIETKG